jgi:hypothetical protein
MTRRPCDQCYGTDTARECAQGQCYAEHYRQQQAEEEWARQEEDWRRRCEEERNQ